MKLREAILCLSALGLFSLTGFFGCSPPASPLAGDSGAAETADGKKSKPYAGKSLSNWPIQFADMQAILELSDAESAELKKVFEEQTESLQNWYAQNREQLAKWDADAIEAYNDKDPIKLKKIAKLAGPRKNEALRLHKERDLAILAALPQQKQYRWEGHLLAKRLFDLTEPLKLTDDQKKKIEELAVSTARNMGSSPNRPAEGFTKLEKKAELIVLTAEQKKAYQPIKKKNAFRSFKRVY